MVFVLLAFTVLSLLALSFYALQIDRNIHFEAEEITVNYQPSFVMGIGLALEFQSTVARFLIKKGAIGQDGSLSPKVKYHLLKRLSLHYDQPTRQ